MKRTMLVGVVICCLSFLTFAEEIRTKEGKSYNVIRFLAPTPDGVNIEYKKNGWKTLHYISFDKLPVNIQKKFAYSPAKAKAYREKIHASHVEAMRNYKKKLKLLGKEKIKDTQTTALRDQVLASSINVILKVTKVFDNGFLAWASNANSKEHSHYGQIFVINMQGTYGDELSSVLYPTRTYKGSYAVYTPYLEIALKKSSEK